MQKKFKFISLLLIISIILSSTLIFTANAETIFTNTSSSDVDLADTVQEGTILHAFDCSYNSIKSKLSDIKNAGFTTVQTSPVQQPKDYDGNWRGTFDQWWKLYQPLSFSVSNNTWLGNKNELTSLCTEAHKYKIKIICDIVVNHMANSNEPWSINGGIGNYEPEIMKDTSKYFHNYMPESDSSIQGVVHGSIGMPDLNTSNSYIQSRVTSLLKECIDCGVDGFRFDAAKHIETPDDGAYASNFWPNVLGEASKYGKTKNKDMYFYGEILTGCGTGRSYPSYTKYMSVTDNQTGNNRTAAVRSNNAANAAKTTYTSGIDPEKAVLWAESHDTYMNDENTTRNIDQKIIDKSYALSAARVGATSLYFIRPGQNIGPIDNTSFKNKSIQESNKFHNFFKDSKEQSSSSDSIAIVERYNSTTQGAIIVNCNGDSKNVEIPIQKMSDGKYVDQITGNSFTVSDGKLKGQIGNSGISVIYDPDKKEKLPENTISIEGGTFSSETLKITLGLINATSGTYKIGNKNSVTYTKTTDITIGSDMKYGDSIKIKLTATNGVTSTDKEYTFTKQLKPTNPLDYSNPLTVYCYNTASWSKVNMYSWIQGGEMQWPGKEMRLYKKLKGYDMYVLELPSNEYTNLIFNDGKNDQTSDLNKQSGKVYFDNSKKQWLDSSYFDEIPIEPTTEPTTEPVTEPSTEIKTKYFYGDADVNGTVEILDAQAIQKDIAKLKSLTDIGKIASDTNKSGDIDIIDATLIQKKIANLISQFPSGEYFYY